MYGDDWYVLPVGGSGRIPVINLYFNDSLGSPSFSADKMGHSIPPLNGGCKPEDGENEIMVDKIESPESRDDEAFFCETCGKPFRTPMFDVAKEYERTIFQENDNMPEFEIIGSVGIGEYCSKVCRDQARGDLLLRENVRATYPDIGPIEPCSRCGKPVDMTKFHLAYVESVLDLEPGHMSTNVLESVVLAVLCNTCSPPPSRLIAEVDFPVEVQKT